jgi:hypothetical protein
VLIVRKIEEVVATEEVMIAEVEEEEMVAIEEIIGIR